MTPQDDWGDIWYIVFGQTRNEIERDAIRALVLTSADLANPEFLQGNDNSSPSNSSNIAGNGQVSCQVVDKNITSNLQVQVSTLQQQNSKSIEHLVNKEKTLGFLHYETIKAFENLLAELMRQNDLVEYEKLLCRSIETRQNALGKIQYHVLTLIDKLADFYCQQRNYNAAERLYGQLISDCKGTPDEERSEMQDVFQRLAYVHRAQGKYVEAEALYLRVLRHIEEMPLTYTITHQSSNKHFEVGTNKISRLTKQLNILVRFYAKWGRYDTAEQMYCRLIVIHRADASHEKNPVHLNGLISLLKEQKRYEVPDCFMRRLHEIYQTALGAEHPYTLHTLNNLAETYRTQQKHEEAETAYLQLLNLQEQVFGPMHQKCIQSLDGLKIVYQRQGNQQKLEDVYLRLIERRRQVLGSTHSDTAQTINNLASLYAHQGRFADSMKLYEELFVVHEQSQNHTKAKAAHNNLERLSGKRRGSNTRQTAAPPSVTQTTSGFSIPKPPEPERPAFALDVASVQQKIAETSQVQELLQTQFVEEETVSAVVSTYVVPVPQTPSANPFKSLDNPHFVFLNMLLRKPVWKPKDIEAVALPLGLMANGALERLNDMALEVCDELLFEGDNPVEVNTTLAKELLA